MSLFGTGIRIHPLGLATRPVHQAKRSGFTLIELLVVVAIIGVLAAIALPRLLNAINVAREGRAKGNLSAMRKAVLMFTADNHGTYPYMITNAANPLPVGGAGSEVVTDTMKRYFPGGEIPINPIDGWVTAEPNNYVWNFNAKSSGVTDNISQVGTGYDGWCYWNGDGYVCMNNDAFGNDGVTRYCNMTSLGSLKP